MFLCDFKKFDILELNLEFKKKILITQKLQDTKKKLCFHISNYFKCFFLIFYWFSKKVQLHLFRFHLFFVFNILRKYNLNLSLIGIFFLFPTDWWNWYGKSVQTSNMVPRIKVLQNSFARQHFKTAFHSPQCLKKNLFHLHILFLVFFSSFNLQH